MRLGHGILVVSILILFSLGHAAELGFAPIIKTEGDQEIEIDPPEISVSVSGYKPMPVFLAIDKVSAKKNKDEVNFAFACRNEGSESGSAKCRVKVEDNNGVLYEGCKREREYYGGLGGTGITVCQGHVDSEGKYLVFTVEADGNKLFFKIPTDEEKDGLLTVFNTPEVNVRTQSKDNKLPYYMPFREGEASSEDYGEFDWILNDLELEDQEGNEIEKYVVNTESFLAGEGLLVYSNLSNIKLKDEKGKNKKHSTIEDVTEKGLGSGRIFWLSDKNDTEYTVSASNSNKSNSETIRVEEGLDLSYDEEEVDTNGVIAGEKLEVKQGIRIKSKNDERPQAIAIIPEIENEEDLIEKSCQIADGTDCYETVIVEPGKTFTQFFYWEEEGVETEFLGLEQNYSANSTDEMQYLVRKIRVKNLNSQRDLKDIEGSVSVAGECDNGKDIAKIDWLTGWSKGPNTCYFSLEELRANESKELEIGFHGDFLDVVLGEIEQDIERISNLEEQFIRREVNTEKKKEVTEIPVEKIKWSLNMNLCDRIPGECLTETADLFNRVNEKTLLNISFYEGEGKIAHDSKGNNHGIINGGKWVKGKKGYGLSLDGKDDYIQTNISLKNNFTIMYWAKTNFQGGGIKAESQNTKAALNILTKDNNTIHYRLWDNNGEYTTITQTTNNNQEWQHITATYNQKTKQINLYINGKQKTTNQIKNHPDLTNTQLYIGWNKPYKYTNGIIDEIKIYNKTLTEEEIKRVLANKTENVKYLQSKVDFLEYPIVTTYQSGNKSLLETNISIQNKEGINFSDVLVEFLLDKSIEIEKKSIRTFDEIKNLNVNGSKISFVSPIIKEGPNNYQIVFKEKKEDNPAPVEDKKVEEIIIEPSQKSILTGKFASVESKEEDYFYNKMILWLSFEEGKGNIIQDLSSNNNKAILEGGPSWSIGKEGLGLNMDGKDDYIQTNISLKNNFTIMYWAKTNFQGGGIKAESQNTKAALNILTKDNNTIHYRLWDNNGEYTTITQTTNNNQEWQHITATYNQKTKQINLYINGKQKTTNQIKNHPDLTNTQLYIGWNKPYKYTNGIIDEIKIYNKTLTEEEIKAIYSGGTINQEKGLIEIITVLVIIIVILIFSYFELKIVGRK